MALLRDMTVLAVFLTLAACTGEKNEKASLPAKTALTSAEVTPAEDQLSKDDTPVTGERQAAPGVVLGETPEVMPVPEATPALGAAPTPEAATTPNAAPTPDQGSPLTGVETAVAPRGKAEMQYRLSGEVASIRKSQVAFRVGGFIDNIAARPGTACKKGDILASLDDRDFALRVELAQARRDQARVAQESTLKELSREKQLKAQSASTAMVYDQVKAAHDQARLALKLTELELTTAQQALSDTKLKAPYDCVVAVQMKHEGENVQSGTPVLEVYDTSEIEISLSAPERLIDSLAVGTELKVFVPSAGFEGLAKVIRMVPVINEKTRTFQIYAKLKDANIKVAPGSYAEAVVTKGSI